MSSKLIIAELNRISEKNEGLLLPADVVKAARPASSPLHSKFEWDDSVAGEKYRIQQARELIRVTVEMVGEDKKLSRVYVSLSQDRLARVGYRPMVEVMGDASLLNQLLQDAIDDMDRFRARYARLHELAKVFETMAEVERKLKGGKKKRSAA